MKIFWTTRLITSAFAIVFYYVASATPISGKVTDAGTGEAIIGATIYGPFWIFIYMPQIWDRLMQGLHKRAPDSGHTFAGVA
jgi:hypothetical protein